MFWKHQLHALRPLLQWIVIRRLGGALDPSENGNNILFVPGIEHINLTIRSLVTVLTEQSRILFPKHTYCIRSRSQFIIV
jgi:hypothetical protein